MTDAWNQYAQVLNRLGRDADALTAYQQMLRQRPDQPSVLLDAATILMRMRRYDDAKAHVMAAISGEPITAHQMLAKIELAQGHNDAALKAAAAAEAVDPTLPLTDFILGVILHNTAQKDPSKFAEALPYFKRASDTIKTRTVQLNDLYYYLGDCLAQVGRLEEAEQAFRQEITLFPNLVRAPTGLAMLYEAAGNGQGTERVIANLLASSPTPSTYASAVNLWRVLGHPDRAAAVTAQAKARFNK